MAYKKTLHHEGKIRDAGYNLVVQWEHEPKPWRDDPIPEKKTVTYAHAIVFDFESYQDKARAKKPTNDLTLESEHVPISFSIGDTLNREPLQLCNRDLKALVADFVEALERRAKPLQEDVRRRFLPEDHELFPKKQQRAIVEWCDQIPVLGFNSGCYDLNLIRNHFVEELCKTTNKTIKAGRKANQTMFLLTPGFKFLDVINYIGPGKTYDAWVKAYGCELTKSISSRTQSVFPESQ